jgi:5-methylcytosine-specific restriction endonuclease McrA
MKLCPDCLSIYKRSTVGKKARKLNTAWGRGMWPSFIYHNQKTRKCIKHHAQALADSAARRASKNNATPSWADNTAIKQIYEDCIFINKKTGIKHEVDHIVPLRGQYVSGLHIHSNLQIIEAKKNRSKSNKF